MTTSTGHLMAERSLPRPLRELHMPRWLNRTTLTLSLIVVVAAILRLYNLQSVGNSNEYYTAAVKAMVQSFHNFFFVAAEPGGSVTIDKPPLGLWLQAISGLIFGVSGVSVVLPQVIAGILSVPALFTLVRRYFGSTAGLIAAFVLAVTPVSIAVERNNTMDATLIFTLLLAAWAYIKATDTGRLRYLVLGGVLVGLGFNIKMMQAFLPLPAFYALYFLGSKVGLKKKIVHLTLATLVLICVSFSWATVVQLTPAADRPYIGSTQDNNVFDLIIGYNGINRLIGSAAGASVTNGIATQGTGNGNPGQPPAGMTAPTASTTTGTTTTDTSAQAAFTPPQGGMADGGGAGGGFNIGTAGVLRLVTSPLANEVGWLLPFGLISVGLLVISNRPRFPLSDNHKAAILFGGWLVTTAVFFSVASFFHPYYLSMLAAPLAALVGIGAVRLWQMYQKPTARIGMLIIALCGGTLAFQIYTASQYGTSILWEIPAAVILAVGGWILISRRNVLRYATVGFAFLVISALWVPAGWATMTTLYANASSSLPEAYSGTSASHTQGMMGAFDDGRSQEARSAETTAAVTTTTAQDSTVAANDQSQANTQPGQTGTTNAALLSYLEANTTDVEYLVAVPSSQQGASLVLATGRPVLYMGGFSGSDPVVDATSLAKLVADGKLRYVLEGGQGGMGSTKSDVTSYLQSTCKVVNYTTGTTTTSETTTTANAASGFGMNNVSTLYECGS